MKYAQLSQRGYTLISTFTTNYDLVIINAVSLTI